MTCHHHMLVENSLFLTRCVDTERASVTPTDCISSSVKLTAVASTSLSWGFCKHASVSNLAQDLCTSLDEPIRWCLPNICQIEHSQTALGVFRLSANENVGCTPRTIRQVRVALR